MNQYVRQKQSQRKHPPSTSSSSPLKALPIPKDRPGWKGPGHIKKPSSTRTSILSSKPSTGPTIQEQHLPVELQQLLLNIFRTTFPLCQEDYQVLKPLLTEIQEALSEGNLERAFGSREGLEVYSIRWSPNRALVLGTVIVGVCGLFGGERWVRSFFGNENDGGLVIPARVVCFGGGAAEVMALGAVLRHLRPDAIRKSLDSTNDITSSSTSKESNISPLLHLHLIDISPWNPIITSLQTSLTTPPTLSKYASPSSKASNASLLTPSSLHISFEQTNILETTQTQLQTSIGNQPTLITLLFTLHDLQKTSIPRTAAFLLKLTIAAPKHSLLLVIDRPDEVRTGDGQERKSYPMRYLMDMALAGKTSVDGEEKGSPPSWEKICGDESRVFRLDDKLRYPISLEDLRFQIHLFRRL